MINNSEQTFELMFQAAPNAIILADSKGRINLVNLQAEKVFGYSKAEFVNSNVEVLLPDRYKSNHHNLIDSFFKNPETRPMGAGRDLFAVKKDSTEIPVEIALTPLTTDDGTFVLISIIDITERKKHEEIQKLYTKQIEAKNKELEQFTYIASHDLREPLQSISSFVQLLSSEYSNQLDETGKESLTFINKAATRMKALIQGLLDYSRIGQKAETKEIDCNNLVKDVLADLNFSIKNANAIINVSNLPILIGYETELRLLFQNLIGNALKFKKTDVTSEISINAEKEKNGWKFLIKDNGIGIEKENSQKIFTIFQRLHRRNEYEGTGIGLAHCRKVVELHNGEIWVESEPGKGSTFYFTIIQNPEGI